jgi:hypothetical protein
MSPDMPRGINDYDTAILQRRLWTPGVLRPALWLDAADLSTITIATGVSEWRDKSGNARHASQATPGNQPAYSSSAFQGMPGVSWDGTNKWLTFSPLSQQSGDEVFAVCDTTNMGTGSRVFINRSVGSAPFPPAVYFGLILDPDYCPAIFWGSSAPAANLAAQASAVRRPAIIRWNISTGTAFTEINGGSRSAESHAETVLSSWTEIGASFGSQQPSFVLAEVILARALSVPQAAAIHGYLSWKWGIRLAADHPYANRPPLIGD